MPIFVENRPLAAVRQESGANFRVPRLLQRKDLYKAVRPFRVIKLLMDLWKGYNTQTAVVYRKLRKTVIL